MFKCNKGTVSNVYDFSNSKLARRKVHKSSHFIPRYILRLSLNNIFEYVPDIMDAVTTGGDM